MSSEITTAMVKQFSSNVFHLSQQQGARLRMAVRRETQRGKSAFWDRIGSVAAQKVTTRHGDTPILDTPHSRRRVTLVDYEWGDMVDDFDKIRTIHDPTNDYAKAAMWALGRSMDDEIIEAALGTAYAGEEGDTSVTLPNTQKITAVSDSAGANMNVEALRHAKEILDANEVDPSLRRYIAMSSSQFRSLLSETETTSSDFNTVRALVRGDINEFMGFTFIQTERLNTQDGALSFDTSAGTVGSGSGDADGYRRCIAWAEDGILHSTALEPRVEIGPRPDKRFFTQVYAALSNGAVRMEEEKVVEILCNEA